MKGNIILITVDSLRFDRVGYASGRELTPNIDKLSVEGVSFSNAFAEGPATPFSFPSMFALDHHPFRDYQMKRTERPVTQVLGDLDYYNAGFVAYNFYISTYFGYDRGFAHFKDYFGAKDKGAFDVDKAAGKPQGTDPGRFRKLLRRFLPERFQLYVGYYLKDRLISGHRDIASSRCGDVLTEDIIGHLKAHSSAPFFLWAHYMDVHSPYIPPKGFTDFSPMRIIKIDKQLREAAAGKRTLTPELAFQAQTLYDQEVGYVDHCIGRLMSFLKDNKLYDDTYVILTSDHGEMFSEHGRLGHPTDLYDELLRVPLIIKGPDVPSGSIEDYLVSLGQIPSTLLHLTSGNEPGEGAPSLLSILRKGKGMDYICAKAKHRGGRKLTLHPKNIAGMLESTPYNLFGLRTNRYKLIFDEEKDSHELYDLKSDPGEKKNIFKSEGEAAGELKNLMDILIRKHGQKTEKEIIRDSFRGKEQLTS